ncbi:UNVERIFIED_CONTAM: hypothetical protein PYX00_010650 [Menopon gallinae]|uniref:Uncharacterized protein n=1 Tax=Menopon gallinae TaxID=328185 RepID=A0AAW2HH66_9NEOP
MEYNSLKSSKKCFCSSSGSIASATSSSSSRSSNGTVGKHGLRTVHLKRQCGFYLESGGKSCEKLVPNPKTGSFGFSFRGGREFGTGFFVSAVESDSEAHHKGLKVRRFRCLPRTPNISATLKINREPPFHEISRETRIRSRPRRCNVGESVRADGSASALNVAVDVTRLPAEICKKCHCKK